MMIMSVAELEELQINLLRDSLEEELKDLEKKQQELNLKGKNRFFYEVLVNAKIL